MGLAWASGGLRPHWAAGRRDNSQEYVVDLEENMIVALEINHYPVKLEHLLRVTANGYEILSEYPMDPELVPA